MNAASKKNFAPIPLRALVDQRLTGHHLRLLGVVAAHDQLGKSGSGCWASQDRLAALLGCSKSRLSSGLSDLREYGYIASEVNPKKRWFRVHRVIYSSNDERFWNPNQLPPRASDSGNQLPPRETDSVHQLPWSEKSVLPVTKLSKETNGLQTQNIFRRYKNKKDREDKEDKENRVGRDCAEARSQTTIGPENAEAYLTSCEAILADPETRDSLILERRIIAEIADDACLPEPVNERASKLLARISEGKGEG